jgi:PIN domain nuclease of toxin-antitoxin system
MSQVLPLYVLDTSALLTLIEDEAGAEQVQELLEKAQHGEVSLLLSNCNNAVGCRAFATNALASGKRCE